MNDNIYKAPEAELISPAEAVDNEFYIVSRKKFMLLFFATLGLYSIYWFYKNWQMQKEKHELSIWPIPRAIFSIFFAHSLFARINDVLEQKQKSFAWSASASATLYVLITVITSVMDQLSTRSIGSPYTDIISIVMLFVLYAVLVKVQQAINISQDDINGESNSQLTTANIIWIVLGLVLWVIVLLSLLVIFGLTTI
jgi:hypothetical protein